MKRFRTKQEKGGGWTVWSCDPVTGQRETCIGWFKSKTAALAAVFSLTIGAWMNTRTPP